MVGPWVARWIHGSHLATGRPYFSSTVDNVERQFLSTRGKDFNLTCTMLELRTYRIHTLCTTLYIHYSDVIMSAMASEITSVSIVCSTYCWGTYQRKHQSSASLAFERGIHWSPVDSPHKGPVMQKMFPCDDIIMLCPSTLCTRKWQVGKITTTMPNDTANTPYRSHIVSWNVVIIGTGKPSP